MDTSAPQPQTIQSLLDSQTLPLLVQRKVGGRLLLHKCIRLPYVICQTLSTSSQSDGEFFLIPLSNKGVYGTVSRHDEPANAHATLSHILESTPSDATDVFIDNVTPVHLFDDSSKKFTHKVLLPGETIHIVKDRCCSFIRDSMKPSLCCFGAASARDHQTETICVKDKSRHMHLDKHVISRFYKINSGPFQRMEAGSVYSLQDITQHQGLPKVVCSISPKQTPRDETTIPRVFRMVKVISDRVVLAYELSNMNHPVAEDLIEISSYNKELLAMAESCRVNMDNIRDQQVAMSVRRALPGKTVSLEDFHEISRKSRNLPPKLPERPPTLGVRSAAPPKERKPVDITAFLTDNNTHTINEWTTPNGADSPHTGPISHTVRLPTRDKKSILKRFSSVTVRAKKQSNPSMREALDRLHGKTPEDNNNNAKQRPKKSLRGLEIVHVLPDAEIDLSQPLSAQKAREKEVKHKSISTATNSSSEDNLEIDDFIHSHYDFLEHHDNDVTYSTPVSEDSSKEEASRAVVRFSGVTPEPSKSMESNSPPKRNLRETFAHGDVVNIYGTVEEDAEKNHIPPPPLAPPLNHSKSPATNDIPLPDYDQSTIEVTKKPTNHLDELKNRLQQKGNSELKTPAERKSSTPTDGEKKAISNQPTLLDELKAKVYDRSTKLKSELQLPSTSKQAKDRISFSVIGQRQPSEDTYDPPYMLPTRSSAIIKLTD